MVDEADQLTTMVDIPDAGAPVDELRHLLLIHHPRGVDVYPLTQEPLVLGRAEPATVVVDDASLSRQHVEVALRDGMVLVRDLGSTNGTWIAGERVTQTSVPLRRPIRAGATTLVVQRWGELSPFGLERHESFLARMAEEQERTRHFRRPMTVVLLRSGSDASIVSLAPLLREHLCPVDRLAAYDRRTLALLLPETSASEARSRLHEHLLEKGNLKLRLGIASFPDAATSRDALLGAARDALVQTDGARPIAVAPNRQVVFATRDEDGGVIAESAAMKEILGLAGKVAGSPLPVLLHGETGVGKEVLARFIHGAGPHGDDPLVAVNCAALPEQLVESILFGHEKGAFTGATQRHAGVFEAAARGTVFLDEVGELPLAVQAKLLRVLEVNQITRLGSTTEIDVSARVLAASHRDLEEMVRERTFREDLLYRLNAFVISIPPLRARRDDISPLAARLLGRIEAQGAGHLELSPEARELLFAHDWPGNVRELRNALERASVLAEGGVIRADDLPRAVQQASASSRPHDEGSVRRAGESFKDCVARVEQALILEALQATDGNQSEAARHLDMPRRTLVHKLKNFGIKRGAYEIE